jgi:hypothetical protein
MGTGVLYTEPEALSFSVKNVLCYTAIFLLFHDMVINQALRTQKEHGVYVFCTLNRDVKRRMALRNVRGHIWSDMNFKPQ